MIIEPEPEVQAVYLRPSEPALLEPTVPVAVAGPETLADAITRTVTGLLERSLHESVTAAVRALAPRMVISFPSIPAVTRVEDDAADGPGLPGPAASSPQDGEAPAQAPANEPAAGDLA